MAPEASTENSAAAPVAAPQSAFISKVSTFPIVTSALDLAKFYYDETKNRFVLVGQVEKELVERVVPQVVSATTKVTPQSAQVIVSKGLSQLDQYATSGLEILEKNVPIIKESPYKIIETVILPVDQFVEKALEFSEQRVDAFLPAESAEVEMQEGSEPKRPRIDNLSRGYKLGVSVSQRLSQKTLQQLELVRKATPQDLQKILSIDLIRLTAATIEKQSAWLKENLQHLTQHLNKEEVNNFIRFFETQVNELRTHFTAAIASLEKVTPNSVKETSHAIFVTLSKSVFEFSEKSKAAISTISLDPASTNDPYLKKALESLNASISQLQFYANSLSQSTVFLALQNVLKAAPVSKVDVEVVEEIAVAESHENEQKEL